VAISGASALTAAAAHWRGGRIDWRLFGLMAPPSLAGGVVGGVVSGLLPQRLLLGAIAAVVVYGSLEVARQRRRRAAEAGDAGARGGAAAAIAIAFAVGVLGGLVGLILGTLRLPAMVKWLGTTPRRAVGTNA